MSTAKHVEMRPGWILALASVGSFMVSLDNQVVTTALTSIHRSLGASIEGLEWTVNAYSLTFAVLLLTGAAVGDRLGRRRMYAVGLGLFAVASAACALSPSIGFLIAARALQGAGGALVLPLALTLLSAAFPPERRGRAVGLFTGVTGVATLIGPFVGGAVAQGLAWQWIFWINVPIAAVAILLVLARVAESRGPNARFDVGGVALVTVGVLGLVWGLVRGNAAGWASAEVISSLAAGVLLVAAFAVWELRAAAPMLQMRFFRLRAFAAANFASFTLFASLYAGVFMIAQFLQVGLRYGPFAAGLRLMPWTATLLVFAPLAGLLADRLGERRLVVGGLLMQAAGMGWLALIARPDLPYAAMLPPLLIGGIGVSVAIPTAQKAVVGAVELREVGQASGAVNMLRMLGAVLGVAITTSVFSAVGGYGSPLAFAAGFGPAVAVTAAFALAGALSGLWLPGRAR